LSADYAEDIGFPVPIEIAETNVREPIAGGIERRQSADAPISLRKGTADL